MKRYKTNGKIKRYENGIWRAAEMHLFLRKIYTWNPDWPFIFHYIILFLRCKSRWTNYCRILQAFLEFCSVRRCKRKINLESLWISLGPAYKELVTTSNSYNQQFFSWNWAFLIDTNGKKVWLQWVPLTTTTFYELNYSFVRGSQCKPDCKVLNMCGVIENPKFLKLICYLWIGTIINSNRPNKHFRKVIQSLCQIFDTFVTVNVNERISKVWSSWNKDATAKLHHVQWKNRNKSWIYLMFYTFFLSKQRQP